MSCHEAEQSKIQGGYLVTEKLLEEITTNMKDTVRLELMFKDGES